MLKDFNLILDGIHDDLSGVVNAEHISALRCALVDFLEDLQTLHSVSLNSPYGVTEDDIEHIRNMIKRVGELYLMIR